MCQLLYRMLHYVRVFQRVVQTLLKLNIHVFVLSSYCFIVYIHTLIQTDYPSIVAIYILNVSSNKFNRFFTFRT